MTLKQGFVNFLADVLSILALGSRFRFSPELFASLWDSSFPYSGQSPSFKTLVISQHLLGRKMPVWGLSPTTRHISQKSLTSMPHVEGVINPPWDAMIISCLRSLRTSSCGDLRIERFCGVKVNFSLSSINFCSLTGHPSL